MKIKYLKQIDKTEILNNNFDLFIAASGYEIRAIYLSKYIHHKCKDKIVFSFADQSEETTRKVNDNYFSENEFNSYQLTGNDHTHIIDILDEYITGFEGKTLSILIDYSSMTRVWYGTIIKHLKQIKRNHDIRIYFSYSEAEFKRPSDKDSKTSNFEPILGYCNLSIPLYPTALITGLGYERNKAFGLKEFFDAEQLFLFYTSNNDYTKEVLRINSELIKRTNKDNIIPYKINDMLLTKKILYELCSSLRDNYRIIIAPLGPKPFTLVSFLVADELQSIDVWRISSNDFEDHKLCNPNGNIVTLEICYE